MKLSKTIFISFYESFIDTWISSLVLLLSIEILFIRHQLVSFSDFIYSNAGIYSNIILGSIGVFSGLVNLIRIIICLHGCKNLYISIFKILNLFIILTIGLEELFDRQPIKELIIYFMITILTIENLFHKKQSYGL